MSEELTQRIEESLDKDEDELVEDLPGLLEDIEGRERELISENPALFAEVLGRMDEIDTARFYNEAPEAGDKFQNLLWTGVRLLVENNPEIRDRIGTDITANFDADDCPMAGHLEIDADEQIIRGGAGLSDDPDLTLTGSADTLSALVTGEIDPVQGFMQQKYELDGSVQKGTQLASVMGEITENVPG